MSHRIRPAGSRRESGSIVMAMLAIIVIGGLVAITFAEVRQSQLTVRRDRSWTASIQAADAGAQQALTYLITTEPVDDNVTATGLGLNTTTNDGTFEWTANRVITGLWEVRATGTVQGVSRVVEVTISRGLLFRMAAFGDVEVIFQGNTQGDSYDSSAGDGLQTFNGMVGSNGNLELLGASTSVDGIWEFGPDAGCTQGCTSGPLYSSATPIDVQGIYDDLVAQAAIDCPDGAVDGNYETVDSSGTADLTGDLTAGTIYCLNEMSINGDFDVIGNSTANPAVVYIFTNGVLAPVGVSQRGLDSFIDANCLGCDGGPPSDSGGESKANPPEPGGLVLNVLNGDVEVKVGGEYAMVIMAPKSNCKKASGDATLYGSMFCGSISSGAGAFEVHYDDRLDDSGTGDYDIVGYREEVGSSTSFS